MIGHRQSYRGAYEVATSRRKRLISKYLVRDKSLTELDSVCDLSPLRLQHRLDDDPPFATFSEEPVQSPDLRNDVTFSDAADVDDVIDDVTD